MIRIRCRLFQAKLHGAVEISRVLTGPPGHAGSGGGDHEVGKMSATTTKQREPGTVKDSSAESGNPRCVSGIGAGDNEDERRIAPLSGDRVPEPILVPEDVEDSRSSMIDRSRLLDRHLLQNIGRTPAGVPATVAT